MSELEDLTRQYPYFGPAQFLLAEKLKAENSPKYEQQSQKAILFFQDHLWFEYLSRKEDVTATISAATYQEPVQVRKEIAEQPTPVIPEDPKTEAIEQKIEEPPVVIEEEPVAGEMYVAPEPEQIVTQQEIQEPATEEPEVKEPEIVEPGLKEPAIQQPGPQPEPEPEPAPVHSEQPAPVAVQEEQDDPEPESTDSAPPIRLPEFKIEPVDLNKPLTFEPYHTIDYFASQGILLKEDDKPKDKFGRQLKSFTEWLKAMKKLPESGITAPPPAPEDHRVTKLAEHSITDSQVVTEAMADVWEKQGNHDKAIDTYRKLSLLDPAKSAYFAAKIEQLKRQ